MFYFFKNEMQQSLRNLNFQLCLVTSIAARGEFAKECRAFVAHAHRSPAVHVEIHRLGTHLGVIAFSVVRPTALNLNCHRMRNTAETISDADCFPGE